jgi:DNA polymerase III delta prime subunit
MKRKVLNYCGNHAIPNNNSNHSSLSSAASASAVSTRADADLTTITLPLLQCSPSSVPTGSSSSSSSLQKPIRNNNFTVFRKAATSSSTAVAPPSTAVDPPSTAVAPPTYTAVAPKRTMMDHFVMEHSVRSSSTAAATAPAPAPAPTTATTRKKRKTEKIIVKKEKIEEEPSSMLVGNERSWISFEDWLQQNNGQKAPIALVVGPAGIGKTTGITKLLSKYHYSIIHLNASDEARSPQSVEKVLKENIIARSLFGQPVAIVLDEIDGSLDTVGSVVIQTVKEMQELKKRTHVNPIICIANEFTSQSVRTLYNAKNNKLVQYFRMDRLHTSDLRKLIDFYEAEKEEKTTTTTKRILSEDDKCSLILQSNGDARSLLQLFLSRIATKQYVRDYSMDPFQSTRFLLSSGLIPQTKFNTTNYMIERIESNHLLLSTMIYENFPKVMQSSMDSQNALISEMNINHLKQKEYTRLQNDYAYLKMYATIANGFSIDDNDNMNGWMYQEKEQLLFGIRTISYYMNQLPPTLNQRFSFPSSSSLRKQQEKSGSVQFAKERIFSMYEPLWTCVQKQNSKEEKEYLFHLIQKDPYFLMSAAGSLDTLLKGIATKKQIHQLEEWLTDQKELPILEITDDTNATTDAATTATPIAAK